MDPKLLERAVLALEHLAKIQEYDLLHRIGERTARDDCHNFLHASHNAKTPHEYAMLKQSGELK